jgi:hypothetical protein
MEPTTINLSEDINSQIISTLEGILKTQGQYTQNAVKEVMRLRAIIAKCDKCRAEANAECEAAQ